MLATNKIKEYRTLLRKYPKVKADKYIMLLYTEFLLFDNKYTEENYKLIENFKDWCNC